MKLYPKNKQSLDSLLAGFPFKWTKAGDYYELALTDTLDAIAVVEKLRDQLQDFEVLHGTMDDVFLNITGRSLRE